jgi:glycosyltransferase involved in cell wall biosynthesis
MSQTPPLSAVIIGRNEGQRLIRCLASLRGQVDRIVYVDSGSTDGSQSAAQASGAKVVPLDTRTGFTAARARNAGVAALGQSTGYVQFIDGDCELMQGWIETARAFLDTHPEVAAVCGRRQERFPDTSVYNRLIDIEWNTPIGPAKAFGGDALLRADAFAQVGGFEPTLIAGEEPELSVRLRQAGWKIWRIDADMTLHDAAITRLGQFWQRCRRAGYAYAEGVARHGRAPERHKVAPLIRSVLWGLVLPACLLLGGLIWGLWVMAAGVLIYALQVLRLTRRYRDIQRAALTQFGVFAEGQGVLDFLWARSTRRQRHLIEYK